MPCEGEVKKWRCGICEREGFGVRDRLPPDWHSFGNVHKQGARRLDREESYCPACWDLIWPHIRSTWYKLVLIKEALVDAITPVRPDEGKSCFRHQKPSNIATDLLNVAIQQLHFDACLTIDRGQPDIVEDALGRHYGDGPLPKSESKPVVVDPLAFEAYQEDVNESEGTHEG